MPAPALAELVDPRHTALVAVELQRGVVGEEAVLPFLAREVRDRGVLEVVGRLAEAARPAGVRVVHCTAAFRADGVGAGDNCRLLAATKGGTPSANSRAAEVAPEVGPEEGDILMPRLHGIDPITGTELDPLLRNMGVTTIVATGVSLNVALLGLVVGAVGLGYRVVMPRDAVAGLPREYGEAVLTNTVSLLATITMSEDVVRVWEGGW
jgi:nicotinamidase-related amidase